MSSNREARKRLGIAGRSELRGPMPVPKKKKKKSPSESTSATSGAPHGSAASTPAGPKRNDTTAQAEPL